MIADEDVALPLQTSFITGGVGQQGCQWRCSQDILVLLPSITPCHNNPMSFKQAVCQSCLMFSRQATWP